MVDMPREIDVTNLVRDEARNSLKEMAKKIKLDNGRPLELLIPRIITTIEQAKSLPGNVVLKDTEGTRWEIDPMHEAWYDLDPHCDDCMITVMVAGESEGWFPDPDKPGYKKKIAFTWEKFIEDHLPFEVIQVPYDFYYYGQ